MLCEHCGKKPATVYMTKIVNGYKTEAHLCQECANESGEFNIGIDLPNIIASFFEQPSLWGTVTQIERTCPTCGFRIEQIRELNQFGCGDCYSTFRQEIEPLLRNIHGSTQHVGKVPAKNRGRIHRERRIASLREQLQKAIEQEHYEKAAEIRDEIRRLEAEQSEE